ncbi:urocanate hydratase [Plakobranchus ocellatus]|uniref:Urocanate hydratase n=1 Tax=Plakobranchus ocellatus TaxID=259542 RepID=A0AAV4DKC8_9GAST|nr:urocanate hydratase [Plakobranchus ocellatus]
MTESRNLKRKADCELAPPYLTRAKMTLNHEPKLKSCLKKARRRGANKKLAKKKVRFEMPVQAPVAYWFLKKVYEIKRGVQSLMEKLTKIERWT